MDISPVSAISSSQKIMSTEEAFKPCATCKLSTVSKWATYKNCVACREVNKMKRKVAFERKLRREKMWTQMVQHTPNALQFYQPPTSDEDDSYLTMMAPMNKPTKTSMQRKPRVSISNLDEDDVSSYPMMMAQTDKPTKTTIPKKSHMLINNLEGEEKREALMEMKNRLKTSIHPDQGVKVRAPGTSHSSQEGKEYQTATALYDSLKRQMQKCQTTKTKLIFNGYHAIVSVQNIDHLARVEMVLTDLRKIVRLPFEYTKAEHVRNFETGSQTAVIRCICLGQEPIIPTLKGNQGDFIKMARASTGLTKPRICGGKVFVTAADDATHPHVLGQRISVRIEHN